jgi:hypothetical protein
MPAEFNTAGLPFYTPTSWAGVVPDTQDAYDIRAVRISDARRATALARANGILSDGETKVRFFVTDLVLDVGLSGNTAQGRYTRDFYAHNIMLPALKISAVCLDQGDYGVITEFVHQAQKKSVGNGAYNRTQLEVMEGWAIPHERAGRTHGTHKRTCAQGFIRAMKRRYVKGEYAPKFDFEFTVAQAFEGIYEDNSANVYEHLQKSWNTILQGLTINKNPTVGKAAPATNTKPNPDPTKGVTGSMTPQTEEDRVFKTTLGEATKENETLGTGL